MNPNYIGFIYISCKLSIFGHKVLRNFSYILIRDYLSSHVIKFLQFISRILRSQFSPLCKQVYNYWASLLICRSWCSKPLKHICLKRAQNYFELIVKSFSWSNGHKCSFCFLTYRGVLDFSSLPWWKYGHLYHISNIIFRNRDPYKNKGKDISSLNICETSILFKKYL